jgi:anaerobic magnesium-protoporphyrin IX monomethyl ester cyclase
MSNLEILLVNPNYRSDVFGQNNHLPVGLGYISRMLQINNFSYQVVDLNFQNPREAYDIIDKKKPKFIGISMMSYCVDGAYGFIEEAKRLEPSLKVVVGGPHVIAAGESLFSECNAIDIACIGEGEDAIIELLRGNPLPTIRGIYYRKGNDIIATQKRAFTQNTDHLPFPTYDGFQLEKYNGRMVLASSRGCPHKCTFCGASRFLGKIWRKRKPEGMLEELLYWYGKGYREFVFEDSLFSADKKRIIAFCEMLIARDLNVQIDVDGARADDLNREVLGKMKEANFRSITFGVESAANHVLDAFKKGESIEQIYDTISIADELGFQIGMFFILGGPGETIEDARKSFAFSQRFENVKHAHFFKLTPIPGTSYFDYALNAGLVSKYSRYPKVNFGFETEVTFGNDHMSPRELTVLLKQARRIEKVIRYRYAVRQWVKSITGLKRIPSALVEPFAMIMLFKPIWPIARASVRKIEKLIDYIRMARVDSCRVSK